MTTKVDLRAEEMADKARLEPNHEARGLMYVAAALYSIDRTLQEARKDDRP